MIAYRPGETNPADSLTRLTFTAFAFSFTSSTFHTGNSVRGEHGVGTCSSKGKMFAGLRYDELPCHFTVSRGMDACYVLPSHDEKMLLRTCDKERRSMTQVYLIHCDYMMSMMRRIP